MPDKKDDDREPEWQILKSDELFSNPYFRFRKDTCELPDQRVMPAYYVWELVDWVNIVPLSTDGHIILVNQYRHAAQRRFYEFPGGTVEPGKNEEPAAAAKRELLEETGYSATRLEYLGHHYPNPGIQDNRMHVYLGTECQRVAEPQLDSYEDILVEAVPIQDFIHAVEQGRPMHSLMLASLSLALPAIKRYFSQSSLAI